MAALFGILRTTQLALITTRAQIPGNESMGWKQSAVGRSTYTELSHTHGTKSLTKNGLHGQAQLAGSVATTVASCCAESCIQALSTHKEAP